MNGAIFGFQKRVWCPKWTPASSICRIDTPAIEVSLGVEPQRRPGGYLSSLFLLNIEEKHPSTRYSVARRGSGSKVQPAGCACCLSEFHCQNRPRFIPSLP